MADALLIPLETVKKRLVMAPELLGVDNTLSAAVRGAQVRVEAQSGHRLQKATRVDTFFLDREHFGGATPPGGAIRLYLTSGLLSTQPTMTSAKHLGDPVQPVTPLAVDPERGIVYLPAELWDHYVVVTATSGYEEGQSLPTWLEEAILGYIPLVSSLGPASTGASTLTDAMSASADHAAQVLGAHERNPGLAFRPMFSQAV